MEITQNKIGMLSPEARDFIINSGMSARYNYWANMPTWTELEAIALVLGMDPAMMTKSLPERMYQSIGLPLTEIKQFISRALNAYELFAPFTPYDFLVWTKSRSVYLPEELERLIPVPENKKVTSLKPIEKSLGSRERETLLKLIIGMAIKKYRYDPSKSKNSAVTNIMNDLNELGIPVSDDTIRGFLNEAKEILPPESQGS